MLTDSWFDWSHDISSFQDLENIHDVDVSLDHSLFGMIEKHDVNCRD